MVSGFHTPISIIDDPTFFFPSLFSFLGSFIEDLVEVLTPIQSFISSMFSVTSLVSTSFCGAGKAMSEDLHFQSNRKAGQRKSKYKVIGRKVMTKETRNLTGTHSNLVCSFLKKFRRPLCSEVVQPREGRSVDTKYKGGCTTT